MLEREALRNMIQQWNANRLDLFELSEPNENLEFHGVMRFYFQDSGQKIATKCIRVASDATVSDVIETLIEKFRPDMRMLSLGSYALYELHAPHDERRLAPHEKPLLVQLNWHADDREGRFLLKCIHENGLPVNNTADTSNQNFKRKLSKREKKELKKKEKLSRMKSDTVDDENRPVAEKLYTELPETSFTRSISNPEAVMRRRRQQKLETKLQQFRSKDGGPDTGGTLKIYGSSLCPDVPYKTLLLSVGDCASAVVREMLDKYGLSRTDPHQYCLVQVNMQDNSEYVLDDDECPLAIVMAHPHRSSIMFHVRRRPADCQPRRRKKKSGGAAGAALRPGAEPALLEVAVDGSPLENARRIRLNDLIEVGSGNGMALQLYGPSIQARHCAVGISADGSVTVTPLHADAHVYVNGQRVYHTAGLQHGCLVKFGRVSTFRFVDPSQEIKLSRSNLSQSQHFDSGSVYDRSTTSPVPDSVSGMMSPTDTTNTNTTNNTDYQRTMSPISTGTISNQDTCSYNYNNKDVADNMSPYNNNTLKMENDSMMMSPHLNESKDDLVRDDQFSQEFGNDHDHRDQHNASMKRIPNSQLKDNYETTFDLDGNVETKSICSAKSGGSGHENRLPPSNPGGGSVRGVGQEAILPAVLEFPESGQQQFLQAVISRLDVHAPAFKLAPVYTLYLCARYRASTHYRPELTPTERAHKLTTMLHHVAGLMHATVQEKYADSAAQAFWMANSSEFLHFLKCDRHISTFSTQAQDLLATTFQVAFSNLVGCLQNELSTALPAMLDTGVPSHEAATAAVLHVLTNAMALLRRCRVNAALTIQLFSHLFHYINAVAFNKLVREGIWCTRAWGLALAARLAILGAWAERQGLEVAADCHMARVHQAAHILQASKTNSEEIASAVSACFKLNSVQVAALLGTGEERLPPPLLQMAVTRAQSYADELYRADGREITLEESVSLGVGLLIPADGFSGEVVRGVPPGLADFLAPLQRAGLCRLAAQPHSQGSWTVYMNGYHGGGMTVRRPQEPVVQVIQLHKNTNGMGLSIVAAKGAGQSRLGIYIKSVVAGGAAAADGRLQAGDQLLSVDGHSLVGITQEKAAEYLVRTGPIVTLEVAKQGAVLHGLATLLQQPSPRSHTGPRRASERDLPGRVQAENSVGQVKPSKSVPALHEQPRQHDIFNPGYSRTSSSTSIPALAGLKSRSSHNLSAPLSPNTQHDHGFYQNVSVVRQPPHALGDRTSVLRSSQNALSGPLSTARPQSAHFSPPVGENTPRSALSTRELHSTHNNYTENNMHQANPMYSPSTPNVNQTYNNAGQISVQQNLRAQAKLAEMSEEVTRRQQRSDNANNMIQQNNRYDYSTEAYNKSSNGPISPATPLSPTKQQPPVAPKPQSSRRTMANNENIVDDGPPLPPTTTHPHYQPTSSQLMPDDGTYIASTMDPPTLSVYPTQQQQRQSGPTAAALANPWQREEREREAEARRRSGRARRDAAIAALVALGGARTPHQQQQLRALQLERDFERRAAAARHYEKESENLPEPVAVGSSLVSSVQPVSVASSAVPPDQPQDIPPQVPPNLPPQPKSILKSNLRPDSNSGPHSPSKNKNTSFQPSETNNLPPLPPPNHSVPSNQSRDMNANQTIPMHSQGAEDHQTRLSQDMANMQINKRNDYNPQQGDDQRYGEYWRQEIETHTGAPPPPERGSSFAVMSQAQAIRSNLSALGLGPPRDKRVSFHDNDRQSSVPAEVNEQQNVPPPLREDPDKFIAEAESMLQSPTTPTGPMVPTHTPGVIGAQEVYRDPRQKRLAEQQKAQQAGSTPIPEKLSFKEKMKMFALESGESNTPKDKI